MRKAMADSPTSHGQATAAAMSKAVGVGGIGTPCGFDCMTKAFSPLRQEGGEVTASAPTAGAASCPAVATRGG